MKKFETFKTKYADIFDDAYLNQLGLEFDGNTVNDEILKYVPKGMFFLETDDSYEYDEPDIVNAPFYHGDKDYFKVKK